MQRYIPKNFEPAEMKKVKLQETMSGLKHDFSIENESNLLKASLEVADDESKIDPIDERKKLRMNGIESFGLTWMRNFVSLIWFFLVVRSATWDTGAYGLAGGDGKIGWRSHIQGTHQKWDWRAIARHQTPSTNQNRC